MPASLPGPTAHRARRGSGSIRAWPAGRPQRVVSSSATSYFVLGTDVVGVSSATIGASARAARGSVTSDNTTSQRIVLTWIRLMRHPSGRRVGAAVLTPHRRHFAEEGTLGAQGRSQRSDARAVAI